MYRASYTVYYIEKQMHNTYTLTIYYIILYYVILCYIILYYIILYYIFN
jgi:hypothetical protein